MKNVRIRNYSGQYFPAFGLNTDQSNSKYGHILRSALTIDKISVSRKDQE